MRSEEQIKKRVVFIDKTIKELYAEREKWRDMPDRRYLWETQTDIISKYEAIATELEWVLGLNDNFDKIIELP